MYDKSIAIVMNMMKHPDTFPYIVLQMYLIVNTHSIVMQFPIVIEECKSRRCLANVHIGMYVLTYFVYIPLDGTESAVVYPLTFLVIKS